MKSPAFQFYPSDWIASQRVQLMSLDEEGAYIRLLCYCWTHGRIPADPEKLARLIGKGASTTLAQMVATMFQADPLNDGWLLHERLNNERSKQTSWKAKSSAGGRKSAEKRQKSKGGSTTVQPPLEGSLENGANQKATLQSSSSSSDSDGAQHAGIAEIPTEAEVVAFGSGGACIPPDYCKRFHANTTERHGWLAAGRLIDWRKRIVRFWAEDRAKYTPAAKQSPATPAKPKLDTSRVKEWFCQAYPDRNPVGWYMLEESQKREYREWIAVQEGTR